MVWYEFKKTPLSLCIKEFTFGLQMNVLPIMASCVYSKDKTFLWTDHLLGGLHRLAITVTSPGFHCIYLKCTFLYHSLKQIGIWERSSRVEFYWQSESRHLFDGWVHGKHQVGALFSVCQMPYQTFSYDWAKYLTLTDFFSMLTKESYLVAFSTLCTCLSGMQYRVN